MQQISPSALQQNELSMLPLPVGMMSPDRSTCVGRNGHLFLLGGTNNLEEQYGKADDDPQIIDGSAAWVELLERRADLLYSLGCNYLQMIIPEKTSVLAHWVPFDINPPSSMYRKLIERVSGIERLRARTLDVYALFKTLEHRDECYRKLDSHFSVLGARSVAVASLDVLNLAADIPSDISRSRFLHADLGPKLHPEMKGENTFTLEADSEAKFSSGLISQAPILPPDGRHVGIKRVFTRNDAPIQKKAIAYANSFFERGYSPAGLTWWFARLFREFHFVWSPELDEAYIKRHRPDVVIAQTIERFLPRVPAA